MALAPLATAADLAAIGYTGNDTGVDEFLDAASTAVRDAAGSPISEVTSTITLMGRAAEPVIRLPGPPIVSVDSVTVDNEVVDPDDYRVDGDRLWSPRGWGGPTGIGPVKVTYTHGLPQVPADIVDLVCRMVIAALSAGADGGEGLAINNGGQQSWSVDGFSESFATSGDAVEAVTEMMLPQRTRTWLRHRFGGDASTVVSR